MFTRRRQQLVEARKLPAAQLVAAPELRPTQRAQSIDVAPTTQAIDVLEQNVLIKVHGVRTNPVEYS